MKNLLYWSPRILSILLILFLSSFALDTLVDSRWYISLPIHLIPSFLLIGLTAFAWKYPKVGGALFALFGFFVLILTSFEAYIISIPALVIGLLFFFGRRKK
ncbi:MAG: hypothetical protein AB9915_00080 [Candidatus Dojkabacteria bacterium]